MGECTCIPAEHPIRGEIHTSDCALVTEGVPARWVRLDPDQHADTEGERLEPLEIQDPLDALEAHFKGHLGLRRPEAMEHIRRARRLREQSGVGDEVADAFFAGHAAGCNGEPSRDAYAEWLSNRTALTDPHPERGEGALDEGFPVSWGGPTGGEHTFYLPWSVVRPHEEQAVENHSQSLDRLAERGGCSVQEAACILAGRDWGDAFESPESAMSYIVDVLSRRLRTALTDCEPGEGESRLADSAERALLAIKACPICRRENIAEAHGDECPLSDLASALKAYRMSEPAPIPGDPAPQRSEGEQYKRPDYSPHKLIERVIKEVRRSNAYGHSSVMRKREIGRLDHLRDRLRTDRPSTEGLEEAAHEHIETAVGDLCWIAEQLQGQHIKVSWVPDSEYVEEAIWECTQEIEEALRRLQAPDRRGGEDG